MYVVNQLTQYTYLQAFIYHSCSVYRTAPVVKTITVRSPYMTDALNISYFKKEINAILRPIFE